jgi:hypothetical protein
MFVSKVGPTRVEPLLCSNSCVLGSSLMHTIRLALQVTNTLAHSILVSLHEKKFYNIEARRAIF